MMADDNQSSPTSIAVDATSTKSALEEGKEEVVMSTNSESETKSDHTLSNGFAKAVESQDDKESKDPGHDNANHVKEEDDSKVPDQTIAQKAETDLDNNNCADSLEGDNIEEYVEEKTYTSETSLVMKSESVEITSEEIVQTTTVQEQASEEIVKNEIVSEPVPESSDKVDGILSVEESVVTDAVETVPSTEKEIIESNIEVQTKKAVAEDSTAHVHHEAITKEEAEEKGIKAIEIPDCADEDGDGFVRIGECLPIGDNAEDVQDVDHEIFTDEQKNGFSNGHHSEHSDSASLPPTPDSALGDKLTHPEIEQFVKSGGLKRVLPGVQKTEQPYSTCTTETKIAMEIREMREREEELRIMREQAALSPVVSPTPPTVKEASISPVPNGVSSAVSNGGSPAVSPSCGYRVSSVFGHKAGCVVPMAGEGGVKGGFGSKESAVEKEIRIARDREEELRKMKGLPPREDDSYVKPSQVKSSQVRVFGKVVGSNNMKQAATAKIQLEIEEQTQREMALRDTGSIQTISQERTDSKVAKLNTPDVAKPMNGQNGHSHPVSNGNGHTNGNGRSSPDVAPYKRGSPSPNGRPASIFNGKPANGISMHKFIASKGKETTFSAPQPVVRNGNGVTTKEAAVIPPNMIKLKRTVSVESKIQQEIMEMKQREEELKLLHMNRTNENSLLDEDIMEHEMNQKNNLLELNGNGNGVQDEDISPRHNTLIAQWEQRIQKAES